MVEQQYDIFWSSIADRQLEKIYKYIQQNSQQNAIMVSTEIFGATQKLKVNPERFGLDKYKKKNDGTYRYLELYRYRITFRIYSTYIRILRIRSTDQEPLLY